MADHPSPNLVYSPDHDTDDATQVIVYTKSYGFVLKHFSGPIILIAATKKDTEVSRIPKGVWALLNLIQ